MTSAEIMGPVLDGLVVAILVAFFCAFAALLAVMAFRGVRALLSVFSTRQLRTLATNLMLGFEVREGTARVEGTIDGVPISATLERGLLTVDVRMTLISALKLVAPAVNDRGTPLISDATGDEEFDGHVYASGPRAALACALDVETRTALREISRISRLDLGQGQLSLRVRKFENAPRAIHKAAALAKRLARATPSLDTLSRRAREEPLPGLRIAALSELVIIAPDSPAAREAGEALSADGDLRARTLARLLVPGGRAAMTGDEASTAAELAGLPADVIERAVRVLLAPAASSPEAFLLSLLRHAVAARTRPLVLAVVEELRISGTRECVEPLREILPSRIGGDVEIREAIETALLFIRGRLLGNRGELSVADADRGNVSLAAQRGEVSLSSDKKT